MVIDKQSDGDNTGFGRVIFNVVDAQTLADRITAAGFEVVRLDVGGEKGPVVFVAKDPDGYWMLPLLLGFSWYTAESRIMDWHRYSGYSILGLLIFRICWGLWGSHTARFSSFVKSPATVLAYARRRRQGASGFVGHNPLGGWSVVALLLLLALQVASGLFAVDVDGLESGPLSWLVSFDMGRILADVHEVSFNVLLALVAVHLLAVVWHEVIRKERLVLPMVHGHKQLEADTAEALPAKVSAGPVRLVVALALSDAVVYLISNGLRF